MNRLFLRDPGEKHSNFININIFLQTVNGGFTEWTEFEECSKTCGDGKQERTRSCTNPEPKHGGQECDGPVLDERKCNVRPCPGK